MATQSFAGKIVLITGGGTGLGLACATRYVSLGATVFITGRRDVVLQKSVAAIKQVNPSAQIFGIPMDVKSNASVVESIEKLLVITNGALPSVILNNAAGNFISPTERLTANAWKSINDIVFMGTVNVTMEIAKRWIAVREKLPTDAEKAKLPQVVFMQVGTSYADRGQPFLAPSAASKAAVLSLTLSLAREFGKFNMRFIMVSPGPIYTEGAFDRLDPTGAMSNQENIKARLPLGRMGTTDEYSNFVAFVTSDAASWLSGVNINFDGGSHANGLEFHGLESVTNDDWDMLAEAIRASNTKSKNKGKSNL